MSDSPRGVLPPLASPENHMPQSTGWPRWMQEAFAHEPETTNAKPVDRAAEAARGDHANTRILSRVLSRS